MGLTTEASRTREMTTEEKVQHLLGGGVMALVVVEDRDELNEIESALADNRYDNPTFRWIDGEMTLQSGSRSASPEAQRRWREAMQNPTNDPTDQPDDWV